MDGTLVISIVIVLGTISTVVVVLACAKFLCRRTSTKTQPQPKIILEQAEDEDVAGRQKQQNPRAVAADTAEQEKKSAVVYRHEQMQPVIDEIMDPAGNPLRISFIDEIMDPRNPMRISFIDSQRYSETSRNSVSSQESSNSAVKLRWTFDPEPGVSSDQVAAQKNKEEQFWLAEPNRARISETCNSHNSVTTPDNRSSAVKLRWTFDPEPGVSSDQVAAQKNKEEQFWLADSHDLGTPPSRDDSEITLPFPGTETIPEQGEETSVSPSTEPIERFITEEFTLPPARPSQRSVSSPSTSAQVSQKRLSGHMLAAAKRLLNRSDPQRDNHLSRDEDDQPFNTAVTCQPPAAETFPMFSTKLARSPAQLDSNADLSPRLRRHMFSGDFQGKSKSVVLSQHAADQPARATPVCRNSAPFRDSSAESLPPLSYASTNSPLSSDGSITPRLSALPHLSYASRNSPLSSDGSITPRLSALPQRLSEQIITDKGPEAEVLTEKGPEAKSNFDIIVLG